MELEAIVKDLEEDCKAFQAELKVMNFKLLNRSNDVANLDAQKKKLVDEIAALKEKLKDSQATFEETMKERAAEFKLREADLVEKKKRLDEKLMLVESKRLEYEGKQVLADKAIADAAASQEKANEQYKFYVEKLDYFRKGVN